MDTSLPSITLIVAHDKKLCIGNNNDMLFRLKQDLQRFKELTMGKPIIMGRKTHESIGRPLPGRCNIIISRTLEDEMLGCQVCRNLDEAITCAKEYISQQGAGLQSPEIMIIGGGNVYRQALGLASKLLITQVEAEAPGDTYFPEYTADEWREEQTESYDDGGIPCTFKVLSRSL